MKFNIKRIAQWISFSAFLWITGCGFSETSEPANFASTTGNNSELPEYLSAVDARAKLLAAPLLRMDTALSENNFIDIVSPSERITGLQICAGGFVDAIGIITNLRTYPVRGKLDARPTHCESIQFHAGENITALFGKAGTQLDSIGFLTSAGTSYGPYGENKSGMAGPGYVISTGSTPFLSQLADNEIFKGFYGKLNTNKSLLSIDLIDVFKGGEVVNFTDILKLGEYLTQVSICTTANFVQTLQLRTNARLMTMRGKSTGCKDKILIQLINGEQINEIFGTVGPANAADHFVRTLGFKTDQGRVYGPYGNSTTFNALTCKTANAPCRGFIQRLAAGAVFRGFFGSSATYIQNINLLDGPAGGQGSIAGTVTFNDEDVTGATATGVQVCHASVASWSGASLITGVKLINTLQSSPAHGSAQGDCVVMPLMSGEYINHAFGTARLAVEQIGFLTNQGRQLGPWGDTSQELNFLINNPNGANFSGFSGLQSVDVLNQIDFAINPSALKPIVRAAPTSTAITKGWWDTLQDWYLIPLHAIVLPDGRVFSYGTDGAGTQSGRWNYEVWNPDNGASLMSSHVFLPNKTATDLFCSAQSVMPGSGKILLAGGDARYQGGFNKGVKDVNVFDPLTNLLTPKSAMSYARWYNTQLTLPDGKILTASGIDADGNAVKAVELYDPVTDKWAVIPGLSAPQGPIDLTGMYYPRMFVLPDGDVLSFTGLTEKWAGSQSLYRIKPYGNGGVGSYVKTAATLPVAADWKFPSAMYQPGKIITALPNGKVALIDATVNPPIVKLTDSLDQVRIWSSMTLLPTGEVLVTGGGGGAANTLTKVDYTATIWNPNTGKWVDLSDEDMPRLYHNTAFLLPDGRVMSAGGGAPGPLVNTNAQAFSPPYLFQKGGKGQLAIRPRIISAASTSVTPWGSSIQVNTQSASAITRVTLVRNAAVTHSFDAEQRFLELGFTQNNGVLTVKMPGNGNIAPPGFYWMFVLDANGTPSKGQSVRLGL